MWNTSNNFSPRCSSLPLGTVHPSASQWVGQMNLGVLSIPSNVLVVSSGAAAPWILRVEMRECFPGDWRSVQVLGALFSFLPRHVTWIGSGCITYQEGFQRAANLICVQGADQRWAGLLAIRERKTGYYFGTKHPIVEHLWEAFYHSDSSQTAEKTLQCKQRPPRRGLLRWDLTFVVYVSQTHANVDAFSWLPVPEESSSTGLPGEIILFMEKIIHGIIPTKASQMREWARQVRTLSWVQYVAKLARALAWKRLLCIAGQKCRTEHRDWMHVVGHKDIIPPWGKINPEIYLQPHLAFLSWNICFGAACGDQTWPNMRTREKWEKAVMVVRYTGRPWGSHPFTLENDCDIHSPTYV